MSDGGVRLSASDRLSGALDHLRWGAAMAVLLGHSREVLFAIHFPHAALPLWAKLFYFLTNFQKEAVVVFFVLSGVLIGGKLMDYAARPVFPVGRYAIDRLTRLYVVLLPALALSLLPLVLGACSSTGVGAWLASLVFLQDVTVAAPACNEPLWSLANEFWYYVLGLLVVLGGRQPLAWAGALVVVAGLLAADNAMDGRNVVLYAPIWAMGMLALPSGVPRLKLPVAVGALVLALALSRVHVLDDAFWLRDILIAGALVLVLNALASPATIPSATIPSATIPSAPIPLGTTASTSPRWGRELAGFSYSLYLTHWPILLVIRHSVLSGPLDPLQPLSYVLVLGFAALAFALAFGFSLVTERQTLRVRRALTQWLAAAVKFQKV